MRTHSVLQVFHEAPVLDGEIDRLGHMNVMYYMTRMQLANEMLLGTLGVSKESLQDSDADVRHADVYCRFHREQFAGAELRVSGGLLDIDARQARAYYEIRNVADGQPAATFIVSNELVAKRDRRRLDFLAIATQPAVLERLSVPAHGRPRTLSLDPPRLDVSLDQLDARLVDVGPMGMMSGRFEREIEQSECDSHGYLREGANLMFRGRPPEPEEDGKFGPPVLVTDEGHRFGWAIMETRSLVLAAARAGDRLISLGADIALAAKSRHSRRWTFSAENGALIGINDAVAVALDLDERRAIEIPPGIRRGIEPNYLPDLA